MIRKQSLKWEKTKNAEKTNIRDAESWNIYWMPNICILLISERKSIAIVKYLIILLVFKRRSLVLRLESNKYQWSNQITTIRTSRPARHDTFSSMKAFRTSSAFRGTKSQWKRKLPTALLSLSKSKCDHLGFSMDATLNQNLGFCFHKYYVKKL